MNKKKKAAPALNAGADTASEETIRVAVRIDEGAAAPEGFECGTTAANAPVHFDPAGFEGISRYKPIAEWTGRLILPLPAQREPDGSVFIEIHNSPRAELIGKIIRLRWDLSRPEDKWFEMIRTTVNFDPQRIESEKSNALILPMRLDGWPAVSALESLAGARPQDDVYVILKEPVYDGGSIYVSREPVQICGSHKGLVRFEGPAKGDIRLVRHYNPASGSFDGASESISVTPKFELVDKKRLVTTTADIEKSPQNDEGWYIYGTPSSGGFVTKALEPRNALALTPSKTVSGGVEVKYYFAKEHFSNIAPSMVRSSMIATDTREWMAEDANERAYCDKYWPVGKTGIVVHLFGWNEAAGEKKKLIVTGHFAFGIAEVVMDPFTGEKRFDIEYKQIYAHNNTAIISGSIKWHNYMGDLKRGWMYTVPVSDTIIQVPELEPYDINGWKINPILGFSRMAEMMAAVYRTGGGSGISSVRPDVSCVQDSHYVLYGSLMTFEKNIKNSRNIFEWLRGKDPLDKDVIRFFSLDTLVSQLKDRITILGLARDDWKNNFENPIGTRNPDVEEKNIRTLLSLKSSFPRTGNDNLIFFAANRNYRMWSVLTTMCGGRVENLKPLAPNSIIIR
jgi:predicted Abi (CAAX) family protease